MSDRIIERTPPQEARRSLPHFVRVDTAWNEGWVSVRGGDATRGVVLMDDLPRIRVDDAPLEIRARLNERDLELCKPFVSRFGRVVFAPPIWGRPPRPF